jgi:DNA topoisomerase-1
LRELGEHPDGGPVQVMPGKYGPYVKWAKINATLPKELTPEAVTLEEALALIVEKAGKSGKKAAPKKAAAKKAAPKAAAAKAAAPKKVAAKKAPAKADTGEAGEEPAAKVSKPAAKPAKKAAPKTKV